MFSWQETVTCPNSEEGTDRAQDGSEHSDIDSDQTEIYSHIATPPPDSSSEKESEDKEDKMSNNAEIKIGQPAFDGKAADAQYWMGSVYAYVALNSHIYDTDTKKITFTLSFCKEGAANVQMLLQL